MTKLTYCRSSGSLGAFFGPFGPSPCPNYARRLGESYNLKIPVEAATPSPMPLPECLLEPFRRLGSSKGAFLVPPWFLKGPQNPPKEAPRAKKHRLFLICEGTQKTELCFSPRAPTTFCPFLSAPHSPQSGFECVFVFMCFRCPSRPPFWVTLARGVWGSVRCKKQAGISKFLLRQGPLKKCLCGGDAAKCASRLRRRA